MSLEALLAENTAAVKELTAAIVAGNAGREAALEAAKNLASEPAKPRAGRTPKNAADTPAEPKKLTVDDIRAAAATFLTVEGNDELLAQRKAFIKSIIDHFKVGKFVEVPEANYAEVVGWIDSKTKDASFNFGGAEPEAEDDMLG